MRFTDFDIDKNLHINDFTNKKISLCDAESKKPIRFQIPRMYMPFGLSGFTPEVGNTKWNIDFAMKGYDEDDNYVKRFYEFLKSLENKIIENVSENSSSIFGKHFTPEELQPMFNSNIKESMDREPKFRVKVDTDSSDMIKPKVFDSEEVDITDTAERGLYQRQSGVAIVELNSVYFLNKKFGLTWKMFQLKTFEPQRLKGFQMKTDNTNFMTGFQFQLDDFEK